MECGGKPEVRHRFEFPVKYNSAAADEETAKARRHSNPSNGYKLITPQQVNN